MANISTLSLKLISQNPFRVLGTFINATQKDILANANKINAFYKVGKEIAFLMDDIPDYPKVERSIESVNKALKSLDFDKERLKYSLFWFNDLFPYDEVSLKNISIGNIDKAISIWEKIETNDSLHNLVIAAAINNDWKLFSLYANKLLHQYSERICEVFNNGILLSPSELIKFFLEEIGQDNPTIINELYRVCPKIIFLNEIQPDNGDIQIYNVDLPNENRRLKYTISGKSHIISFNPLISDYSDEYILAHRDEFTIENGYILNLKSKSFITSKEWVETIYNILGERLISKAESLINEIHAIDKRNVEERKEGAERLLALFKGGHFSKVLNQGMDIAIRGKIVKEALDCVIDFYNYSENQDSVVEDACNLTRKIRIEARGTIHQKRIVENYLKLKEHLDSLPPKEIKYYLALLEERIKSYEKEPSTITNALKYIKDCAPYLMSIKSVIGENHSFYIKVSTRIAEDVVNDVIEDFNKQSQDITSRVKNVSQWEQDLLFERFRQLVKPALTALYQLTNFGMDEEFKERRYQKNYDIIKRQAIDSGAVNKVEPGKGYSIVVEINGKFKSKQINKCEDLLDEIDIRDEKGYFESCNTLEGIQEYMRIFPSGQYLPLLKEKIEECYFNVCCTLSGLENFISKYPNSKFDVEAKREEIIFRNSRTINDYQIYISKYPNGKYVNSARERIDDLRFESCKGRLDYQKYLSDFPGGKHNLEAQRIIDDIDYGDCKTIKDLEHYLEIYPQGSHVKEAKERLEDLIFLSCEDEQDYKNYLQNYPEGKYKSQAQLIITDYSFWKECENKKSRKLYKEYLEKFPQGIHRSLADERLKRWWRDPLTNLFKDSSFNIFLIVAIIVLIAVGIIWGKEGYKGLLFVIGYIGAIGLISSFFALFSKIWKPFVWFFIVTAIGLGGGIVWDETERYIEKQKKIKEDYLIAKSEDTIIQYRRFLSRYPDSKQSKEVLKLLFEKCYSSGWKDLIWFSSMYHNTVYGNRAFKEINERCDSILETNGFAYLKTDKKYKDVMDSVTMGYSKPLISFIENIEWQDEETAWNLAERNNTIEFYSNFIQKYPYSGHVSQAEKRIIDLEVNDAFIGSHGELPSMNKSGYSYGTTSTISIYNNTSYALTVMYSGKDSKKVVISPQGRVTVTLPNGEYKCVASISGNTRNHAGTENLEGGSYEVEYYIVSSTLPSFKHNYKL